MRKSLWIVLVLGFLLGAYYVSAHAQSAPVIGPNDAIGFDYLNADFSTYAVDRFEVSYDGGGWASLGIPPVASATSTVSTYRVIPPQSNGTHSVAFRACNVVGCSVSSGPFAFAVLGVPSAAPGNIRRIPR
jgi:hypothetical protein